MGDWLIQRADNGKYLRCFELVGLIAYPRWTRVPKMARAFVDKAAADQAWKSTIAWFNNYVRATS
jgi:hypothetical protein